MSKDRPRAGLAVSLALFCVTGAGSAGAEGVSLAVGIGAGINHTLRAPVEAANGRVSVVDAIDVLSRSAIQPPTTRQPSQGPALTPIGGLRGLLAQGGLDALIAVPTPVRAGERWTAAPRISRAAPYIRFSEDERVLGISFKIQPPQQTREPTSLGP